VRLAGWMVVFHSVAVAAYTKRRTEEPIRSTLLETGVYVRYPVMAPDTCVGFWLAGFKLVVSVKGSVIFLYVAAETELHWVGHTSTTQQIAIGRSSRLSSLAIL